MLAFVAPVIIGVQAASAECRCVSIAADVGAAGRGIAIRADNLFAAGNFEAAAVLYAKGWEATSHAAFLYARAQCHAALGQAAKARALFQAYVEAGASVSLKYGAPAKAALASLGGPVKRGLGAAVGGTLGLAGGLVGGAARTGVGATGAAAGAGADLAGSLAKKAEPPKVAKGAAILLGVVAVVAIGAVGIQGISAGLQDDVDFDKRFGLGMGLSGAVVGGTAIYLYGLTAATGAVGAGCLADKGPTITPVAHRGGAGAALAARF